jgi:hypothetical protein
MKDTLKTIDPAPAIDPAVMADLEAVCNTKGIVRDPDLLRRINERSETLRRQTLATFGVQEIAADIVREMRDAE